MDEPDKKKGMVIRPDEKTRARLDELKKHYEGDYSWHSYSYNWIIKKAIEVLHEKEIKKKSAVKK